MKLDQQLFVKPFVILQNYIKLYLVKMCLNFVGSPQVCTGSNADEKLVFCIFYNVKNDGLITNVDTTTTPTL